MSSLKEEIKAAISKVNSTLGMYEKDYISQQRTPETEREVCRSFDQFVECKLNYECSKLPRLKKVMRETEGHLFLCTKLLEPDLAKRKFKMAFFKLLTPAMVEDISDELTSFTALSKENPLLAAANTEAMCGIAQTLAKIK